MDPNKLRKLQQLQSSLYDDESPNSYYETEIRQLSYHPFTPWTPIVQTDADREQVRRRSARFHRIKLTYRRLRRYWSTDARRTRKGYR